MNTALVTEHIQKLPASLAETVEAIRQTILAVDPLIGEQIKWNSPAFYYTGEMKPFDPKEYKQDIVVLNLHRGHALLVFPTGARITDATGLLEGRYTDGRRLVTIRDLEDLKAKETGLQEVIRLWLAGVE
jgi:hypothetical protein